MSSSVAFTIRISCVAALGGLLFGFDTAVISGAIPYIKIYFQLSDYSLGWAVSSILIGCAIGAAAAGRLADHFGRRFLLFVCAILFAISGIGAGLAQSLSIFVGFRLLGGLGVGAAAMISPMYIAETAPASLRGRMVSLYQFAILLGIMLAYLSNYLLDGTGPNNWRWMFGAQAAPSLVFLVLLLLVPETPRWLYSKGHVAEATDVLEKINGQLIAARILEQIQASFSESRTGISELFNKRYRAVLWIGILIAVFQQITGINAILYYAPVIFKQTGLDSSSALLQTIGIGAINMLATLIAIALVDKLGRRTFLLWGSALMGLSLLGIGLCFHYQYFGYYFVLIFLLAYVAVFGCTLGAVTWVYLSEIFPNRVRSLALSIATLALWLADFAVTFTFPILTGGLGTAFILFLYAGCCLLAFLYILLKVPETKGKTLEEIENLWISES